MLVLAAAAVVLSAFADQLSIDITAGVVIVLTFAGVGLVIARRQPGNPIGWIMVVFTLVYVLCGAANYYAVLYYRLGHRGLPLAPLALLLSSVQAPSFAMFPVVILLFPDGRVPGRRWRWTVLVYAGLVSLRPGRDPGRAGRRAGRSRRAPERPRQSHRQRSAGRVAG